MILVLRVEKSLGFGLGLEKSLGFGLGPEEKKSWSWDKKS